MSQPPPPPLGATPEPSATAEFLRLLMEATNAAFDCGEHPSDTTYGPVALRASEAKTALVEFVEPFITATATARAALAQCEAALTKSETKQDEFLNGLANATAKQLAAESALSLLTAKLAQEGEDRKRLDWLEKTLIHSKWDDAIPAIRPRHPTEFYPIAKYIGEDQWNIREAIDAAMAAQAK